MALDDEDTRLPALLQPERSTSTGSRFRRYPLGPPFALTHAAREKPVDYAQPEMFPEPLNVWEFEALLDERLDPSRVRLLRRRSRRRGDAARERRGLRTPDAAAAGARRRLGVSTRRDRPRSRVSNADQGRAGAFQPGSRIPKARSRLPGRRTCPGPSWPLNHGHGGPREITDGVRFFQLYVFKDRGLTGADRAGPWAPASPRSSSPPDTPHLGAPERDHAGYKIRPARPGPRTDDDLLHARAGPSPRCANDLLDGATSSRSLSSSGLLVEGDPTTDERWLACESGAA